MIKKITLFLIFPMLVLALLLSLVGVERIALDNTYYNFIKSVNNNLSAWSIAIPQIPLIPTMVNSGGFWEVLDFLKSVVNGLSSIINVFVLIINIIIKVLQFVLTLVWTIKDFIGTVPVQTLA